MRIRIEARYKILATPILNQGVRGIFSSEYETNIVSIVRRFTGQEKNKICIRTPYLLGKYVQIDTKILKLE